MPSNIELILVPTDFSPYSCETFSWAALFASQFDSKILILHVIPEGEAEEMVAVPGNPWERVLQREDEAMSENFKACLISDFETHLQKETLVAVGRPHEKIIETAKERNASMIVMSTHGRTGLPHILMGSVAERVVRLSPCPVFTIKPTTIEAEQGS